MPVQAEVLDRRVVLGGELVLPDADQQPDDEGEPDEDVQAVGPGHAEVERVEQLDGLPVARAGPQEVVSGDQAVVQLVGVLDVLVHHEHEAEHEGQHQEGEDVVLLAELGRPDGEGHGDAAGDQGDGVQAAQKDVQVLAADDERVVVFAAIYRIAQEEPAEEHHFRQQEEPHPQVRGIVLLVHVVELVTHVMGMVCVHVVAASGRLRTY